jgi:hypothetical protein
MIGFTSVITRKPDIKAQDQTAQQLADCIPQGRVWNAKNILAKNVRKLIICLASAFNIVQQLIETMSIEFNIYTTNALLPEWETSVGLPNDCTLQLQDTIDGRREEVIERLKKTPIVTLADLQAYVDKYFTDDGIRLFASYDDYPPFGITGFDDQFYLIIGVPATNEFEYDFEMEFTGGFFDDKLFCMLNKIIPANVVLVTATL